MEAYIFLQVSLLRRVKKFFQILILLNICRWVLTKDLVLLRRKRDNVQRTYVYIVATLNIMQLIFSNKCKRKIVATDVTSKK